MVVIVLAAVMLLAGSPAWAAGGYGHVEFTNSGAAAAQADFLEGMAMLHDFEYAPAAEAFRRAEAADPGFAMAYWGEAMTHNHPIWMQQDVEAARAALAKLAPTAEERRAKAKTDREKEYLDAVEILYGEGSKADRDFRYEAAMKQLHEHYPDDVNATAFYGLSILGTAHAGRDIPTYMRAAGVLEQAWTDHQEHPGLLHYLIHSYDDPAHAPLGLRMARIYARIAPDAAHAQHMTSHIFLALGMWRETVTANVAAVAAENRKLQAAGKPLACCGHYPSWLAYAYLQLDKPDSARMALETCLSAVGSRAADDHPGDHLDPDESLSGSFENMRLRYLIDTGDWTGEVANLPMSATAGPGGRLDFAFSEALVDIGRKDPDRAKQAVERLQAAGTAVSDIEAERKSPDPSYGLRPKIFLCEARGLVAEVEGDLAGAETQFREAVRLEETLPIAFGPPIIDKPTHELLGEFLLRHGRKDEARVEFLKALARTPGRRLAEEGLASVTKGPAGK